MELLQKQVINRINMTCDKLQNISSCLVGWLICILNFTTTIKNSYAMSIELFGMYTLVIIHLHKRNTCSYQTTSSRCFAYVHYSLCTTIPKMKVFHCWPFVSVGIFPVKTYILDNSRIFGSCPFWLSRTDIIFPKQTSLTRSFWFCPCADFGRRFSWGIAFWNTRSLSCYRYIFLKK